MKRDLKKAIQEYKKNYEGRSDGAGAFYMDDLRQIQATAEGMSGFNRDFELINNALMAGFMIGYRKGKADTKKGIMNNG